MMAEQWRPVVGFEGKYEVSDFGRVRSVDRWIEHAVARGRRAYTNWRKGRLLRPGRMPLGHLSVVLGRVAGSQCVHRLVLEAFVGPRRRGQEVLHRNGDSSDNRLENLRYGTRSENNRDISRHDRRKVTCEDVRQMRRDFAYGVTQTTLSKQHGVCLSQVGNIVHRRQYRHVE